MTVETYTARSGKTRYRPVMTEAEVASIFHHEGEGFCIGCGQDADEYCDPDTRQGICPNCGQETIYGLEALIVNGIARIGGKEVIKS